MIDTDAGMTFFELLVNMALLGILSTLAMANLPSLRLSFNGYNSKTRFLYDIRRAHSESVKEGCRGIISVAGNGKNYTFGCDYPPYDSSVPPIADTQFFSRDLPTSIYLTTSGNIIFDSKGQSVDKDNFLTTRQVSFFQDSEVDPFVTGTLLPPGMFTLD